MKYQTTLRQKLKKMAAFGAVGVGLLGGSFKGSESATRWFIGHERQSSRLKAITQQSETCFDLSKLDEEKAAKVQRDLDALKKLPEMESIFANLPHKLQIIADPNDKDASLGSFGAYGGKIKIDYTEFKSDRQRMCILAHELCHANQEASFLAADSNQGCSFAETFRIGKLGEIDARLLEARVERRLRAEGVLSEPKSEECSILDKLVEVYGEQGAKEQFVLLHWVGNTAVPKEIQFSREEENCLKNWYKFYNKWCLNQANFVHNKMFAFGFNLNTLLGKLSAPKVARIYMNRMGLSIPGENFLTDMDNVRVCAADYSIDELLYSGFAWKHIVAKKKGGRIINYESEYNEKDGPSDHVYVFQGGQFKKSIPYQEKEQRYVGSDWCKFLNCVADPEMDLNRAASLLKAHPEFVNCQTALSKETPIMIALDHANDGAVRLILKRNPNLLLRDKYDTDVLSHAVCSRVKSETRKLVFRTHAAQEALLSSPQIER